MKKLIVVLQIFITVMYAGLVAAETPPIINPPGKVTWDNMPYQNMPWGKQPNWVTFSIYTSKPLPFDYTVNLSWIGFATMNHYGDYVGQGMSFNHPWPSEILMVDNATDSGAYINTAGQYEAGTMRIFLNVDENRNHEDAMVTLFHEFLHHYFHQAGIPGDRHHSIMCDRAHTVDIVSVTGFRNQVCDPNIGW